MSSHSQSAAPPRQRNRWVTILAPARENPGQWFQIEGFTNTINVSNVNSIAHNIRTGRYAGVEKGEFEVRVDYPVIYVKKKEQE